MEAIISELEEAKSALESYFYESKELIENDKLLDRMITSQERNFVKSELESIEKLLSDNTAIDNYKEINFPKLLKDAKSKLEPILGRAKDNRAFAKAIKDSREYLSTVNKKLEGTSKSKKPLNAKQIEDIKNVVKQFDQWLDEKEKGIFL